MRQHRKTLDTVTLLGLDFGSTTTSLMAASARVGLNCATGRMGFSDTLVTFRPDPIFTPFNADTLDLEYLRQQIAAWLTTGGLNKADVFAGGAIVTGLAAEQANANAIAELVREMIGDCLVATADDPRLESWLAFMGSAAAISRADPQTPILNLDIGGGTTNPALGIGGNVVATGSYFVGARHVRFEPGTYRLTGLSRYGKALLAELSINRDVNDELDEHHVETIVGYFVAALAAIATGDKRPFGTETGQLIEQVAFTGVARLPTYAITFSGGVGELIYLAASGMPLPSRTYYGDLGIDLARGILSCPILSRDVGRLIPEHRGRATVQGLTLHSTEISGATVHLPSPDVLPLRDLPIVGSLDATASQEQIADALHTAGNSPRGACLLVTWGETYPTIEAIKTFAENLHQAMLAAAVPEATPLVILTTANVGKALGSYTTAWQHRHGNLIVFDEITARDAQFVNIGREQHGIVPVSFYELS